jgi:phage terminase small subunit
VIGGGAMALTKREKAFCEEYVANGGNASRAYFACYDCASIENARKMYCKVFRKPEVKEYIKALQREAFESACINAERVALKLADIAFADKDDEVYGATAQLKALDLLQKQLGLQSQKIEADLHTDINITIEE